jgi:hypothetical protein
MYHGANSFAKEHYRETIHAGFGCNNSVPYNRGASESGRWHAHAHLYAERLHQAPTAELGGDCGSFSVEKGALSGL